MRSRKQLKKKWRALSGMERSQYANNFGVFVTFWNRKVVTPSEQEVPLPCPEHQTQEECEQSICVHGAIYED